MKYTPLTKPPAGPVEVQTIYVDHSDRFIVSLVVGYDSQTLGFAGKPIEEQAKQAAAAALELTRDAGSSDTFWYVYDRATKRMFEFEQSDFQDREVL